MTELLYFKDNYIKNFKAQIIAIDKEKNRLTLDKTAFYVEGGGQETDKGWIIFQGGKLEITKVQKKGKDIWHNFKKSSVIPEEGEEVEGELDWERRYYLMKAHTAQHVLSHYLLDQFGANTVGNAVKKPDTRADFHPLNHNFTEEEMARISQEVNEILAKDMPVSIKFLQREEAIDFLTEKGYQRQYLEMVPTSVKEFRIIQIDDWDWSSCGGTHVKSTGEIGKIKIVKRKNVGAEKERLYFNVIE
jgi:misacylated tRNA(Ala) deacylase